MTFIKHAHGKGPEHYAHEDDRGVFELYPAKGATDDKTGLGFECDDLEAMFRTLTEFGPDGIRQTEWGRSFVVRDPDGRRIELTQS